MSQRDAILRELRAARVAAPPELRERMLALAAVAPARPAPPARGLRSRRSALLVAAAAVALALGGAFVVGLVRSGSPQRSSERSALPPLPYASPASSGALAPAPARGSRAQDYDAELAIRVDDVPAASQRALRLTRSFGGYVRQLDVGSRGGSIVVRVPLARVQQAIVAFSGLGELASQHVTVRDAQPGVDARLHRLQAMRAEVRRLQRRLEQASGAARQALAGQLAQRQRTLLVLQRLQARERRRLSFATMSLSLARPDDEAAPRGGAPAR
jgi:hypothetical protein